MKELYPIIVELLMIVAATTLVHVYALRNSFDTFMSWDPPIHVLKVRLLLCNEVCRCTDACTHVDYSDRRLHCELARPYRADESLYFERRIGLVEKDQSRRPVLDNPSKDESTHCSLCDTPVCPDLVTDGTELVLNNFGPTPDNQGWIQVANFSWSPGQDGWNSSSCAAHSQCPCTAYDTRKTPQTAMRGKCRCDSDCVDAESGCRDGQCWCKPGLSHDSNSSSCVAHCPGEKYGSTFQEVRHFRNANADYRLDRAEHTWEKTDHMNACFERSLILQRTNGWVIKYVRYYIAKRLGYYVCDLYFRLNNPVLNITEYHEDTTSLIRDCKK